MSRNVTPGSPRLARDSEEKNAGGSPGMFGKQELFSNKCIFYGSPRLARDSEKRRQRLAPACSAIGAFFSNECI